MKWNTNKVALTGGIIWAAGMFLTTLAAVFFGYGRPFLAVMMSIYPGYSISLAGSIIGSIYGFLDVFIGVYIFIWIYKMLWKK